MTPAHRVGGVEIEPAPRTWPEAFGIVLFVLFLSVVPGGVVLLLARLGVLKLIKEVE